RAKSAPPRRRESLSWVGRPLPTFGNPEPSPFVPAAEGARRNGSGPSARAYREDRRSWDAQSDPHPDGPAPPEALRLSRIGAANHPFHRGEKPVIRKGLDAALTF